MPTRPILIAFIGIQVLLVLLDLTEGHLSGRTRFGEHLRWKTIGFLLIVTLVFFSLHCLGLALIPKTEELFARLRDLFRGLQKGGAEAESLTGPAVFIVASLLFYIAGFWDYVTHRYFSHSRWFWYTHEYHHLPNQVSVLMPGISFRPFVAVPSFLTTLMTGLSSYALLCLIRHPLWDLSPISPVLLFIATVGQASHSSCLRRFRVVHRVMRPLALTTPQEHVLHHTLAMNVNYGNFTTLWDRVFGTYLDPMKQHGRTSHIGLPYDQDFLGTLTFGLIKLPGAWRTRFQLARYCNVVEAIEPEGVQERSADQD